MPKTLPVEITPLLVPVCEAARLLSVSRGTVRNLVRQGELSAKKLSQTRWLITMESLRQFVEEKTG